MTRKFPVVVLVAAHGRNRLLRRTMQSIVDSDHQVLQKIVVVENGPTPVLDEVVGAFTKLIPVQYLHHERANKSEALNVGLEHVATLGNPLVVLVDDDVRVDASIWTAYAEVARQHPDAFFGGPIGVDYEQPPPQWLLPFMTWSVKGWSLGEHDRWAGSRNFLGANWAAFHRDLVAIGGFDGRFGPGAKGGATGQESNAQIRLRGNGVRGRFVANARLWHYVNSDQVTTDWTLKRRQRAGKELAAIVSKKVPRWACRGSVKAALLAQRIRFQLRYRPGKSDAVQSDFARKWHAAYRAGAHEELLNGVNL